MRVKFTMNHKGFEAGVRATISKVGRATRKATVEACEEILADSLSEVPRDTQALADSAFYEIEGSYKDFSAVIGYGGNGDPMNPKSKKRASQYAEVVHEDLQAVHPVGKAKYLEDPIKKYSSKYTRSYAQILRQFLGL